MPTKRKVVKRPVPCATKKQIRYIRALAWYTGPLTAESESVIFKPNGDYHESRDPVTEADMQSMTIEQAGEAIEAMTDYRDESLGS